MKLSLLSLPLLSTTALLAQEKVPLPSATPSDSTKLEPIVVTAAAITRPTVVEADPRAPAQPVPAHDGADVLKAIPGFSVIRKGGTDGDPMLRGFAGSRLGIQIDGESIFGGCGNRMDPPTAYVFPAAYDRVTVIKGPQTVLHGPGNSAGVVLFERETPRYPTATWSAESSTTVASFGRLDLMGDLKGGTPLLQARATGTYTRADDYKDGSGTLVHSAYERWSSNASLGWTPDANTLVEVSGARSDGEAAYADRAMDGVKFDRSNIGFRAVRQGIASWLPTVEARYFYNYVDHVMDNYTLRPFVSTMMMANRSVSNPDRLTTGARLQATVIPLESLSLDVGADTQRNKHTVRSSMNQTTMPYETRARVRDAEFTQYGIFGEASYAFDVHRKLIAGARVDQWKAEDPRSTVAISMMSTAANPSAGRTRKSDLFSGFTRLEQKLGGESAPMTVFLGVGRTQRFPDYWELIKNESATSVTAFGTAPETTTQWDAGLLYHKGTFTSSISLFTADIGDYILVQSGVSKAAGMMGTRSAVITRNIDASTYGGEAAVSWLAGEHLRWDASLAYVHGKNDTDHSPLAQQPPLEGRLALTYATPRWSVGALARVVAEQDRVAVNQGNIVGQDIGRTPGFAVFSLNAGYRLGARQRISAGVDNLLDRRYAEHVSRAGSAVSGFVQTARINEAGRTVWLRLDAQF